MQSNVIYVLVFFNALGGALCENGTYVATDPACINVCTNDCTDPCPLAKVCVEGEKDCGPAPNPYPFSCTADRTCVPDHCDCKLIKDRR